MSMKVANGLGQFPMQDEHEKGKNGVGMAWQGASANVECRGPEPGTDPGISQIERSDGVCRVWARGGIRLGGALVEGAALRRIGQRRARSSASLCEKSNRDERGSDDTAD